MRTFILALSVAALAAGSTTACATKGFVRNRVGDVNDKVESVSKSLEETQERTRKNEAAIADANQKIVQVDQKAAAANEAAATARTAADSAATKAAAVEVATKRIVYEVTLSEDQGNFKFSQAALPAEAKARIDEVVKQLKATPNGAYIEVEGYTDNLGAKAYNEQLGLDRAESVKRYLYQRAPDPAASDQRHQLRLRQAGRAEHDQGGPRAEPPRGDQGAGVTGRDRAVGGVAPQPARGRAGPRGVTAPAGAGDRASRTRRNASTTSRTRSWPTQNAPSATARRHSNSSGRRAFFSKRPRAPIVRASTTAVSVIPSARTTAGTPMPLSRRCRSASQQPARGMSASTSRTCGPRARARLIASEPLRASATTRNPLSASITTRRAAREAGSASRMATRTVVGGSRRTAGGG